MFFFLTFFVLTCHFSCYTTREGHPLHQQPVWPFLISRERKGVCDRRAAVHKQSMTALRFTGENKHIVDNRAADTTKDF